MKSLTLKRTLLIISIGIGILAFCISFWLEFLIFENITEMALFAFCITGAFEGAKVFTIILHRFIEAKRLDSIPNLVATLVTAFKIGLVTLSVVCSIAMISRGLEKPNLDSIKENDRKVLTSNFDDRLALIENQRKARLDKITNEVKEKYKNRYHELDTRYLPKIRQKESLRDSEFNNVQNGQRRGPIWREHDRQLNNLKAEYKTEKDALRFAENNELERNITKIENEFQIKNDKALDDREKAIFKHNNQTYESDDRVKNAFIMSFISTLNTGIGLGMEYLTFTLMFSVLTGLLLEGAIYSLFSYSSVFYTIFFGSDEDKPNGIQTPLKDEVYDYNRSFAEPATNTYHQKQNFDSMSDQFNDEFNRALQDQFQESNDPLNNSEPPCAETAKEADYVQ